LPAPWTAAAEVLGGEATLDASIVYAALPANTDVVIANSPGDGGWYGLFANAAQGCGIVFATSPSPGDVTTGVPAMSKGPDYPVGGCIITLSYGGNEVTTFQGEAPDAQAASVVLERLA
jgi:hypothetical protein